jgi:hypothetical protein
MFVKHLSAKFHENTFSCLLVLTKDKGKDDASRCGPEQLNFNWPEGHVWQDKTPDNIRQVFS